MTTLHENIRRLRKAADLTATQAAESAGMTQGTWSNLEGGNTNPTQRTLTKIAEALGVTLAELFVDEDGESVNV